MKKLKDFVKYFPPITACVLLLSWLTCPARAQSTSQDLPTPVMTSEIVGTIKPCDIGDPRLTTYFYTFDASVGDLFLNISARNFTGDIDLFTVAGLRPLAKIILYADREGLETGRVVYFRKPEKLLLRIQGRTPGDEAANFHLKFAGSFIAATETPNPELPELPKVTAEGPVRVNAVGTIIQRPTRRAAADETAKRSDQTAEIKPTPSREEPAKAPEEIAREEKAETPATEPKKLEVVVTENAADKETADPPRERTPAGTGRKRPTRAAKVASSRRVKPDAQSEETKPAPEPDPLERINLVVIFKDGSRIERPMSEVLRFTVDKGKLVITSKDGATGRYSLLDVAKVTIE